MPTIFPSQPMDVEPIPKDYLSLMISPTSSSSKRSLEEELMEHDARSSSSKGKTVMTATDHQRIEGTKSTSEHGGPEIADEQTLRRRTQNKEAARRCMHNKQEYVQDLQAYVQQLEKRVSMLTQRGQELENIIIMLTQREQKVQGVPSAHQDYVSLVSSSSSSSKRSREQSNELHDNSIIHHPSRSAKGKEIVITIESEGNRMEHSKFSSDQEGPYVKRVRKLAENGEGVKIQSHPKKKQDSIQHQENRPEQEIQSLGIQGLLMRTGTLARQGLPPCNSRPSSDTTTFAMKHGTWQAKHDQLVKQLRVAIQVNLPENMLRVLVDKCLAHHNEMIGLESAATKHDVFHVVFGMWKNPMERCFAWMGGFRPSELIKIIQRHVKPLTEQQTFKIKELQYSTQRAEEVLSKALEDLHGYLLNTITSDVHVWPSNMADYMHQMTIAAQKLSSFEDLVKKADQSRQHVLNKLCKIITVRQAALCFMAIAEYSDRLRALRIYWLAHP